MALAIQSQASIERATLSREMPGWRNGRRRGLKILWAERPVRVRVPPPAISGLEFWKPSSGSAGDHHPIPTLIAFPFHAARAKFCR
jgi:hypothetical protein